MLQTLLDGQATVEAMADLARGRLREKHEQVLAALDGQVTDHMIPEYVKHFDNVSHHVE